MTAEERIAQLEAENAGLWAELISLRDVLVQVQAGSEERIAQLEAKNAGLWTGLISLRDVLAQVQARLAELEGRQAKGSHNSSKPPSSDGLAR